MLWMNALVKNEINVEIKKFEHIFLYDGRGAAPITGSPKKQRQTHRRKNMTIEIVPSADNPLAMHKLWTRHCPKI